MGQKTIAWRFNNDDVASAFLDNDGWDAIEYHDSKYRSEAEKFKLNNFLHSLVKEDRRNQADFMKQLEVGDSLGVWVRVDGLSVSMIEEVRMHTFWAAS